MDAWTCQRVGDAQISPLRYVQADFADSIQACGLIARLGRSRRLSALGMPHLGQFSGSAQHSVISEADLDLHGYTNLFT